MYKKKSSDGKLFRKYLGIRVFQYVRNFSHTGVRISLQGIS